jgi:hypothetical protein
MWSRDQEKFPRARWFSSGIWTDGGRHCPDGGGALRPFIAGGYWNLEASQRGVDEEQCGAGAGPNVHRLHGKRARRFQGLFQRGALGLGAGCRVLMNERHPAQTRLAAFPDWGCPSSPQSVPDHFLPPQPPRTRPAARSFPDGASRAARR